MTDERLIEQANRILADRNNPYGWGSVWSRDIWVNAAEYAIESGDVSELRFLYSEDDRWEAESREESRRLGDDLADRLYDDRVTWGMA